MDKSDWLSKTRGLVENAFVAHDLPPHQGVADEIMSALCENYPDDEGHYWERQEHGNTFGHKQEECFCCHSIRLDGREICQ